MTQRGEAPVLDDRGAGLNLGRHDRGDFARSVNPNEGVGHEMEEHGAGMAPHPLWEARRRVS